jgi:hypothetical protein
MRRTPFFSLLLAASTLLAACGGDDGGTGPADPTPEPQPSEEGTFFAMENHSERDAWYVFVRACGTTEWGQDMLGNRILDVNERITWTVNSPGCFDVRAQTNPGAAPRYEAVWTGVQVAAEQTTTVRLDDADWEALPGQ